MARDIQVNGETLVNVRFGAHVPVSVSNIPGSSTNLSQLGLSSDPIKITYEFYHQDLRADDFGPNCPPDVQSMMATVKIGMRLVHYDKTILDYCTAAAMGGIRLIGGAPQLPGVMEPAGKMLGANRTYLASGYHFIGLNLVSAITSGYHFPAAYLETPPYVVPLGTERSIVDLNWRAIPYQRPNLSGDVISSGVILWNYTLDT